MRVDELIKALQQLPYSWQVVIYNEECSRVEIIEGAGPVLDKTIHPDGWAVVRLYTDAQIIDHWQEIIKTIKS
jgi:hypothetical protein